MASTQSIIEKYSTYLDSMTSWIRSYAGDKKLIDSDILKLHKGVSDFCYNNSSEFVCEFLKKSNIDSLMLNNLNVGNEKRELFIQYLSELEGECVFLLKDTYDVMDKYQKKTKKGFGILINRKFLCRNEEDYFLLIDTVYRSLEGVKNISDVEEKYYLQFEKLMKNNIHFRLKAKEINEYVRAHTVSKKVVFVDLGFQFTFSLFCFASLKYFGKGLVESDYYNYSTYIWLQDVFKGKYFSTNSELVLDMEIESIQMFDNSLQKRATATLLGFAIGDSLGFPVAGIDKNDIPIFLSSEIQGYTANKKHPFFSHLNPGQYTDNTNLMMISAEHLIQNKGFVPEVYEKDLILWGKNILESPLSERWAGPTALTAVKNMIQGKTYSYAGSVTTKSCSSTYRVLPLGIYFRPFYKKTLEELISLSELSSGFTHNSIISRTGAVLVSLIIGNLMNGMLPMKSVEGAILCIKYYEENTLLLERIKDAIEMSETADILKARKYFGTGSPIYQTLPLSIFCFLKYKNNFEEGILAAANSYRDDTPQEKSRIKDFTWEEQLQEAEGGNTDGIAGLTGAFFGAYLGEDMIPKHLLSIENRDIIKKLAIDLIS